MIMKRNDIMTDYSINLKNMGLRIKELRLKQQKTQEYFANQIHISTSYLALIENGKRTATIDVLAQIAKECHVSVDYLLFDDVKEDNDPNTRFFLELCSSYKPDEINKALSLADYYLRLNHQKD